MNIANKIIGGLVGLCLLSLVMIPVISAVSTHVDVITIEQSGEVSRYTMVDNFEIAKADGVPWLTSTIYDDPVNYGTGSQDTFIILENVVMARYGSSWYLFYILDGERYQTSVSRDGETISYSDGVLTVFSTSIPCKWAFLLDPQGDWAFMTYIHGPPVWNVDKVYNFEYNSSSFGVVEWSGNEYHTNFWGDKESDLTETYTPNRSLIGSFPLGDGYAWTLLGSLYKWMVPVKYTYEQTVQSTEPVYELIKMVPVICVMAIGLSLIRYERPKD